jgi:hypothetical protein
MLPLLLSLTSTPIIVTAKSFCCLKELIKSYVKNKVSFKLNDNSVKFNISVKKNNSNFESYKNVDEYVLENWNYNPNERKLKLPIM